MRFLSIFLLFPTLAVAAHPLSLIPVGDFGGFRVKAPCFFGTAARLCTLDTMGSVSVIPNEPDFERYPVIGHERVEGIGQEFSCDVVNVRDLQLLGRSLVGLTPLRCEAENSAFPLIGVPFFEGRKFLFDFPGSNLAWDVPAPGDTLPLLRIGGERLWIAVPARFAGEDVLVSFDTGNPVTILTRAFVDAHPASFRPSLRPISPGLLAKGLLPFDVLEPIVVGGVALNAEWVYAGSRFPAPIFEDAAVILGMNHAAQARWWFDLDRARFHISKQP